MKDWRGVLKKTAMAAAVCGLCAACVLAVDGAGGANDDRADRIEAAVRRAATACYAAEGRYPEDLEYLYNNYGLSRDGKYAVHYGIFASNLPPDVDVVPMAGGEAHERR